MRITQAAASNFATTFPIEFQNPPVVSCSVSASTSSYYLGVNLHEVTTTGCEGTFTSTRGDAQNVTDFELFIVGY